MKRINLTWAKAFVVCATILMLSYSAAHSCICVPDPASPDAYRVYYHNSGIFSNCTKDYDMDFAEFINFISNYGAYMPFNAADPVVADCFTGCSSPDRAHGDVVEEYFRFAYGEFPLHEETANFATWAEMIEAIALSYGRGTAVNLSNGVQDWTAAETQAVEDAYSAEVLLVGSPLTFLHGPESIGDKVLQCFYMDGLGNYCAQPGFVTPNLAAVGVPTNWYTGSRYRIAVTAPVEAMGPSWEEHGSFSTPLLCGAVQHIVDVVASRNVPQGEFIHKVLDYVISSCDRNVDPGSYLRFEGTGYLPSFGPWSYTNGYGVFSAWKAMLYAYGFGALQARDAELNPGQTNPATVFSDDFYLRGDLFVPASQLFRVDSLASVAVDPSVSNPEGPSSLGHYSDLQEIRIAGSMEVETSRQNPASGKMGVNASLTIDDGGECAVESGGTITIGPGQVLRLYAGGTLIIETGGQLIVEEGGTLILDAGGEIIVEDGGSIVNSGQFDHFGALSMQSGAQLIITASGAALLGADVVIPAGALFVTSAGTMITAASSDAGGTGYDASRVEIICHGDFLSLGSSNAPSTFAGQSAGAGQWSGIFLDNATTTGSSIQCANVSDAVTGLHIEGGSGTLLLMNIGVHDCTTGIKVRNREGLSLLGSVVGGSITNCTFGMKIHCEISIDDMKFHNNTAGLWITGSDPVMLMPIYPVVRNCDIYANGFGVYMADSLANCDLGTTTSHGDNDFAGPAPYQLNTYHIWAVDPMFDIYAQYNWWGTKKKQLIEPKIKVWWGNYHMAAYFEPFLLEPPAAATLAPGDEAGDQAAPAAAYLDQNRPNPFNPTTRIAFGLAECCRVQLKVYDVAGRLVRVLADDVLAAGAHERVWDGRDSRGLSVASGVYFYRLSAKDFIQTKKMVLLR